MSFLNVLRDCSSLQLVAQRRGRHSAVPSGAAMALRAKAFYAFPKVFIFSDAFFFFIEVVLSVLKSSKPLVANISAELEADPEG